MRVSQFDGHRLASAAGAVAAGFGVAQSAEAAVIFQDFDPPAAADDFSVDFDGDSMEEFTIGVAIDGDSNDLGIKAHTFAAGAGVILDAGNDQAANLALGTLIGPADTFAFPGNGLTRLNGDTNTTDGVPVGNFNDASGYIGVQFELSGNTHFGYVGYEGDAGLGGDGRIFKIGYEDTPGLGILAGSEVSVPEPTSLALLAAGAAGLGWYRRRRSA